MKKILLISILVVMTSYNSLLAEETTVADLTLTEDSSFNVGFKAGTLGVGLDISKAINEDISLRLNINGFVYNTTDDSLFSYAIESDKEYTLQTVGLLMDYHLLQLRVTAGAYLNNNKIVYKAKPEGINELNFNGTYYGLDQIVKSDTTITFDNIAPYIGVGWGNNTNRRGWNVTLDVGLLYHGEPNVDIDVTINDSVPSAVEDSINAAIEVEEKIQEEDYSSFPFYPVVMVGINYSF